MGMGRVCVCRCARYQVYECLNGWKFACEERDCVLKFCNTIPRFASPNFNFRSRVRTGVAVLDAVEEPGPLFVEFDSRDI
jgi:hypothetical protein